MNIYIHVNVLASKSRNTLRQQV